MSSHCTRLGRQISRDETNIFGVNIKLMKFERKCTLNVIRLVTRIEGLDSVKLNASVHSSRYAVSEG